MYCQLCYEQVQEESTISLNCGHKFCNKCAEPGACPLEATGNCWGKMLVSHAEAWAGLARFPKTLELLELIQEAAKSVAPESIDRFLLAKIAEASLQFSPTWIDFRPGLYGAVIPLQGANGKVTRALSITYTPGPEMFPIEVKWVERSREDVVTNSFTICKGHPRGSISFATMGDVTYIRIFNAVYDIEGLCLDQAPAMSWSNSLHLPYIGGVYQFAGFTSLAKPITVCVDISCEGLKHQSLRRVLTETLQIVDKVTDAWWIDNQVRFTRIMQKMVKRIAICEASLEAPDREKTGRNHISTVVLPRNLAINNRFSQICIGKTMSFVQFENLIGYSDQCSDVRKCDSWRICGYPDIMMDKTIGGLLAQSDTDVRVCELPDYGASIRKNSNGSFKLYFLI